MATRSFMTRLRELRRYNILTKLYWTALLCGLGYLFYYDFGIYQRNSSVDMRRESEKQMQQPNSKRPPRAILIGFRRCGGGAVVEHLHLHKEISFYENTNYYEDIRRKRELNSNQFPQSAWNAIGVDRCMDCLYRENAAELFHLRNSSMQFIVAVCDPVKRAVAEYKAMVRDSMKKEQSYPEFEDVVLTPSKGKVNNVSRVVAEGQYFDYLPVWLEHFKRNQFHFVSVADFCRDSLTELQKIEEFLHLEPQLTLATIEEYHREKEAKRARDKEMAEQQGPVLTFNPEIKNATLNKLYDHYKEYNKELFDLIDESFVWKRHDKYTCR